MLFVIHHRRQRQQHRPCMAFAFLAHQLMTFLSEQPLPALQKMLMKGWVKSEWGLSETKRRVRKYRLTAAGRKQLAAELAGYDQVNRAIQSVLKLA